MHSGSSTSLISGESAGFWCFCTGLLSCRKWKRLAVPAVQFSWLGLILSCVLQSQRCLTHCRDVAIFNLSWCCTKIKHRFTGLMKYVGFGIMVYILYSVSTLCRCVLRANICPSGVNFQDLFFFFKPSWPFYPPPPPPTHTHTPPSGKILYIFI